MKLFLEGHNALISSMEERKTGWYFSCKGKFTFNYKK